MLIHKNFVDPAASDGSEGEKLVIFRQVRDEIETWITHIFRDQRIDEMNNKK